jgi:hypothetical protein
LYKGGGCIGGGCINGRRACMEGGTSLLDATLVVEILTVLCSLCQARLQRVVMKIDGAGQKTLI